MLKKFSVCAGLVVALCAGGAMAQPAYPNAPVRLIVPQSAGSGGDAVARLLGDKLAPVLGQSVVVENRPGANGVIAAAYVAKARPDGYTVMLTGASPLVFNPSLYKKLSYDPVQDFTYIAPVADTPFVLVASKSSGITDFDELRKEAEKNPGALTFSSAGVGNSTHLATEMMADRAGIRLLHVPFNGSGPALSAVLGGQVDLMFSVVGAALPQIQAGAVTPLLILGTDAVAELPGIPNAAQVGLDLPGLPAWYAVLGPAGMDAKVAAHLEDAVVQALKDADLQNSFKAQYLTELNSSSKDFAANAEKDMHLWGDLIQRLGIQIE